MINESEVRQKIIAVLSDEIPLEDFEDWLVAESWDMHRDSAPAAQDLVSSIELLLAEYSSGHRTEAELRAALLSLVTEIVANFRVNEDYTVSPRAKVSSVRTSSRSVFVPA